MLAGSITLKRDRSCYMSTDQFSCVPLTPRTGSTYPSTRGGKCARSSGHFVTILTFCCDVSIAMNYVDRNLINPKWLTVVEGFPCCQCICYFILCVQFTAWSTRKVFGMFEGNASWYPPDDTTNRCCTAIQPTFLIYTLWHRRVSTHLFYKYLQYPLLCLNCCLS